MHTIRSWCRANAMLVISLLAAAATAFFVPPDSAYLGYYDLKTLSCLFSVLAVVGALRDLDVFSALSQRMVHTFPPSGAYARRWWSSPCSAPCS